MSRVYTGRIHAPRFDLEQEWSRLAATWELHTCRPRALSALHGATNTTEAALLDVIHALARQRCPVCETQSPDTLRMLAQVAHAQLLSQARRLQEQRAKRQDTSAMEDLLWK